MSDAARPPTAAAAPGGLRLLQALAGGPSGGAELHFVRLARAFARAGVEQRIVLRPSPGREAALAEAGIVFRTARFGGPLDRRTRRILAREIAAFRPHVVLTYMSRATRHCPSGDFVHVARLGGYYDLKYYRGADHLVAITPDIGEHCVRHGVPRERVHVIPNFVEDRRAPPADRSALETPADAPLVFALGRLHRNKAFDILLEAMALVDGAWLWLAGEGPERPALESRAMALGIAERTRFLGWRDDPAPLFAAADVFVVPSRHEPLGSVLIEGWMHGVPMVAAASQGPRWLLRDGETGLLVPVDDAPALAEAIRRLLDDRAFAAGLAAAGRKAYEAGFTEEVALARFLDLFDRVRRGCAASRES